MRKLEANDVEFTISVEPEDMPVRGSFASGDADADRALEDEIITRLASGDVWAWCHITVTAKWESPDGTVYGGRDTLSACSYASEKDFIACDDYYPDMRGRALEELNEQIPTTPLDGALRALDLTETRQLLRDIAVRLSGRAYDSDACTDVARLLATAGLPVESELTP